MSYERCQLHNLMRCTVCSPREKGRGRVELASPPLPGTTAPISWSPEDALDAGQTLPAGVDTTPQQPDAQALEAIARQREIEASRANPAPEVEFGDEVVTPGSTDNQKAMEGLFHPDPPFQIGSQMAENAARQISPVVTAAQEFAAAKVQYRAAVQRVEAAEKELASAQEGVIEADKHVEETKKFLQEQMG